MMLMRTIIGAGEVEPVRLSELVFLFFYFGCSTLYNLLLYRNTSKIVVWDSLD